MKLTLLENKIAVIPLNPRVEKIGSIIVPEPSQRRRPTQGIILFRGPDATSVRVGDHVIFGPYSGTKLSLVDHPDVIIMREDSIDAILDLKEGDSLIPLSIIKTIFSDSKWDFDAFRSRLSTFTLSNFET